MYSILIADDEEYERKALMKIIGQSCKEISFIYEASNGIMALEMWNNYHPDIIFLDIKMPGKTGIEVVKEIRQTDKEQVCVFLSAYNYFSYAKEAVSLGVNEYLLKPTENQTVAKLIKKLTEQLEEKKSQKLALEEKEKTIQELTSIIENSITQQFNSEEKTEPLPAIKTIELPQPDEEGKKKLSARLIKLLQETGEKINNEYMKDLKADEIAGSLNLSTYYFSKVFKTYWGINFVDYLNEVRFKNACLMLDDPTLSIKDVSERSGFSEANYFSRVFKNMSGKTPSEYRNESLQNQ